MMRSSAGIANPNVLPDTDLGVEPHAAPEELHDATRQREAEPGALFARAAPAALLERLEDPLPVLLGYADPRVGHGDLDLVPS